MGYLVLSPLLLSLLAAVPAPERLFTCTLGPKVVTVTKEGAAYVYRYGRPGAAPELTITSTGSDGKLFYGFAVFYQGRQLQQLRFVNGDTSYILQHNEMSGSLLAITRGAEDLSQRECKGRNDGFTTAFTEEGIAEDSEEHIAIR